jgi:hypothetical protein
MLAEVRENALKIFRYVAVLDTDDGETHRPQKSLPRLIVIGRDFAIVCGPSSSTISLSLAQ